MKNHLMKSSWGEYRDEKENQQIGWPKGFRSSGISAGIKVDGSLDMALIYSDELATAAGVFTTNQVCAAPVKLCRTHLKEPQARAIVVNSGVANACTGKVGMECEVDASLTAKELHVLRRRCWFVLRARLDLIY